MLESVRGCLAGVTRELVLELTDATEAPVPMSRLAEVSEAFLTSSTRDIHPIALLDGRPLPAPGPHTAAALAAWQTLGIDP